jgi:23S rRNA (guanosine2251-2'-O)-methyltransferase
MNRDIVVIAHNLRSCQNVGSLLRTADGIGVSKLYFTGYTPYPKRKNDERLPHLAEKIDKRISKTSLGSEKSVDWIHSADLKKVIRDLKIDGYTILALEQTPSSISLEKYTPTQKTAVILGRETDGIEDDVLKNADGAVYIPMLGAKESFNVAQAAAMALYRLRFF